MYLTSYLWDLNRKNYKADKPQCPFMLTIFTEVYHDIKSLWYQNQCVTISSISWLPAQDSDLSHKTSNIEKYNNEKLRKKQM